MAKNLPSVSVVIPAANAAEHLPDALVSIRQQDYPNIIETVVASADDATTDAAEGATVVPNPGGSTPMALNLAIGSSKGELVVRCDAHSTLPENYVSRAVDTLLRTEADNVGGMQVPVGKTPSERAIAAAMSSPLGAGDARYRIGGVEGPVETVYLGVFRRTKLAELGGYDEAFVRTQDYELNHRIIESGGTVWFDPELRVEYRPRGTLKALARQYWEYGKAKRAFGRRHAGQLRWRQMLPPLLVLGLATSMVLGFIWPWAWLGIAVYGLLVMLAAISIAGRRSAPPVRTAAALATMHMSWGLGFLTG